MPLALDVFAIRAEPHALNAQRALSDLLLQRADDARVLHQDSRTGRLLGAAGAAAFFFGIGLAAGLSNGSSGASVLRSSLAWAAFGALCGAAGGRVFVHVARAEMQRRDK